LPHRFCKFGAKIFRALLDNCSCVHSICRRCPASPSPVWLRTALHLTLLFVGLLTCQSIRTSSTLTTPELRLHAYGSAHTLDCCAPPATSCEWWSVEPQLTPHPPVVAKSCPNPRAHKAELHCQRGTLVESRPCWQVVPSPSQSPSFLYTSPDKPSQSHSFPPTSPDEHHPTPEPFFQSSLFLFPRFPQHIHLCKK